MTVRLGYFFAAHLISLSNEQLIYLFDLFSRCLFDLFLARPVFLGYSKVTEESLLFLGLFVHIIAAELYLASFALLHRGYFVESTISNQVIMGSKRSRFVL